MKSYLLMIRLKMSVEHSQDTIQKIRDIFPCELKPVSFWKDGIAFGFRSDNKATHFYKVLDPFFWPPSKGPHPFSKVEDWSLIELATNANWMTKRSCPMQQWLYRYDPTDEPPSPDKH